MVALVVVYGVGDALFAPAFTAIVPDVVPQEEILQASALKELMEPVGLRFAGPALGGFLIAGSGVGLPSWWTRPRSPHRRCRSA